MSKFFIRRPIVAIVISILMVIVGAITITNLPVAQFPDIAPPEIRVFAIFPGADAETMEKAVATPIEQQVSGVDNMDYMYSLNSTGNSSTALMVDFDLKSDPNTDLLLTQSRQQLANGQLPPVALFIGIDVKKSLTSPMMLVALYSPKGTYDTKFLANYAYINLNDPIGRSYGVGLTQIYAGQYAMRIWLKPDRLAKLGVTVGEVAYAVQSQNMVNPAGQVGGEPAVQGQTYTYTVRAQSRLKTPEEFGNIVVREDPNGGVVRVKDIASVELGSQDYAFTTRYNGKPAAVIGIYQLPGSNAVEAAKGIRKLMAEMKESFPADMEYEITLDTTDAVRAGMKEIVVTLFIAFVLVIIVVYVFLQDWRATLIPMLAVPVSLVGTFIVFPFFGFSVNTLSLFGLVLAIGLVVDDAIVVVEGIQRHIEEGLPPKAAAGKAMEELTGPVVGIALVLAAVFVPTVFIPGVTGRLYQQFALTIAISVIVSAFNALTLSPALGGLLLRPKKDTHGPLARFFGWFNRTFERGKNFYLRTSGALIRKSVLAVVALAGFASASLFFMKAVPKSFLPDEDQGYMYVQMQLPEAASIQATAEAARAVEDVLRNTKGGQVLHHRCGIQSPQPDPQHLQRVFLCDARAMGRPEDLGGGVPGHQGEVEPEASYASPRHRLRLLSTRDSRCGHLGRFSVCTGRPFRKGFRIPGQQPQQIPGGGSQTARNRHGYHYVYTERAAEVCGCGQGEVAEAGSPAYGCLCDAADFHGRTVHQLLQPVRSRVAGVSRGGSALPR